MCQLSSLSDGLKADPLLPRQGHTVSTEYPASRNKRSLAITQTSFVIRKRVKRSNRTLVVYIRT